MTITLIVEVGAVAFVAELLAYELWIKRSIRREHRAITAFSRQDNLREIYEREDRQGECFHLGAEKTPHRNDGTGHRCPACKLRLPVSTCIGCQIERTRTPETP